MKIFKEWLITFSYLHSLSYLSSSYYIKSALQIITFWTTSTKKYSLPTPLAISSSTFSLQLFYSCWWLRKISIQTLLPSINIISYKFNISTQKWKKFVHKKREKDVNRSIFNSTRFFSPRGIYSLKKDAILISDTGIRYSTFIRKMKKNENSLSVCDIKRPRKGII